MLRYREARRHRSDRAHAVPFKAEEMHRESGRDQGDEGGGQAPAHSRQQHQQRDRGESDGERRPVSRGQPFDELRSARHDAARFDAKAEQHAELAQYDVDGDAIHEADQNRLRQKVGDRAKPQEACADQQDARDEGQRNRERQRLGFTSTGERSNRRSDDRSGRSARTDHQLPGGAEQRVSDHRQRAGIQANDRREADQLRRGHTAWNRHRGDGEPRSQVVREVGASVARERRQSRSEPGQSMERRAH